MGKRTNTLPKRNCIHCDKRYSSKLRYNTLHWRDDPELFDDGRYIGNKKVRRTYHNHVEFDEPYYYFKDGNFCTARCAGDYANRMTGASYCVNFNGTEASWLWE